MRPFPRLRFGRGRALPIVVAVSLLPALLAGCSGADEGGSAVTTSSVPGRSSVSGACTGTVEAPSPEFIVDTCGRVLILRGVNVESASKGDTQAGTHLPRSPMSGQAALAKWGWNNVRFLVFWGAIEPTEGHYDEKYLASVAKWLDWYAAHDIHVVLDMHQDLYAWKVGGDGAPDWAVDTRGLTPGRIAEGQPWYLQGADPAVQAAFQSFWNPEPGQPDLQRRYLGALGDLAKRFSSHPAVIGYDVMNEPSFANGDLAATLAIQPKAAAGEFVNDNLTVFTQKAIDAVRDHDDDAWVMVEPTSLLNAFPYPGDLAFERLHDPRKGAPRLVYAGHLYQQAVHDGHGYPEGDPYLATWEKYRTAEAKRMSGALWIGEWGGADQPRMDAYVEELTAMADRNMAGWAYWPWDPGGWSPVESDGSTVSANGSRLMRVQPRAIAGTPESFSWDPVDRVFTMRWRERRAADGASELAVPSALFGAGIDVVLDGRAARGGWERATSVLSLDPDRSLAEHTVCVQPAGSDRCPA
ncbi:MAG: cellulase family glycosylhydrolase [Microthrixaceae bacterium]